MAAGTVDGYTEDDLKLAASSDSNGRPKNNRKNAVCPHCGKTGHSTKRSKQCLLYNGAPTAIPAAAAGLPEENSVDDDPTSTGPIATAARNSLAQAIRDMNNYDSYPLTDDPPSDISLSAFQDAGTWSDEEEDVNHVGKL